MLRAVPSRPDLADPALVRRWAALATLGPAADSAFLSPEWTFCLAAERFTDPVLIECLDGADTIGLALFNRRPGRRGTSLHLHETGDPAWDSVFIEHNGVLALPDRAEAVAAATLRCALGVASRVVLSGVDDGLLRIARRAGWVQKLHTRPAPFLPLPPGGSLLQRLSRNTRAQLRRSDRSYDAPVVAEVASTADQALDWLDRLLPLHVATWAARGVRSGFAEAEVQRFHRALIRRGVPGSVVEMVRVSAGDQVIGYLLNLRAGGRVAAYQGGFDYGAAATAGKPGLTSHAAAIALAWRSGASEYDFLAGDGRYKRSLASAVRDLHWLELCRPFSLSGLEAIARRILRR